MSQEVVFSISYQGRLALLANTPVDVTARGPPGAVVDSTGRNACRLRTS